MVGGSSGGVRASEGGARLLHGDVGEHDFVELHVGVGLDVLEDLLLDLFALGLVDQVVTVQSGEVVGDEIADDRLLRSSP